MNAMKRKELEALAQSQQEQILCLLRQANEAAERLAKQETTIRGLEATIQLVNNHTNDLERRFQRRVGDLERRWGDWGWWHPPYRYYGDSTGVYTTTVTDGGVAWTNLANDLDSSVASGGSCGSLRHLGVRREEGGG